MDEWMGWLADNAWASWLGAAILLTGLELMSLDLIMLMLATGAVVGMVAALVGLPFAVQILAAGATAVAALVLVRPSMTRRLHGGPELELGHTNLIGTRGTTTTDVAPGHSGQVKLGGELWAALPYDEQSSIPAGATVEVFEIRGATAYVHPLPVLGD